MTSPLRIVFAGTPLFAEKHLAALIDSEHQLLAVYTQPDRPAGRGKKLTPSPVKVLAEAHNIEVQQPLSLKDQDAQDILRAYNADVMVVVAYGLLLPKAVLDIPKHGCINVHGSVLPRWRGAAPIQRAVEAGDTHSGVTIMQMDVGLDTGDMLLIRECEIGAQDNSADLHDRLAEIGPPALLETLQLIANSSLAPQQQDDALSNYARKIEKSEAIINWQASVEEIDRQIRAFNPFPIAYSELDGQRLKIHRAQILDQKAPTRDIGSLALEGDQLTVQCGTGKLVLTTIQLPGKKAVPASAFINGFGEQLKQRGSIVLGAQA